MKKYQCCFCKESYHEKKNRKLNLMENFFNYHKLPDSIEKLKRHKFGKNNF